MAESKIRYIACVGYTATLQRISVDLECNPARDRRIVIVREEQDVHRLYGIAVESVVYVEMGMSPRQASFVRGRGLNRVSIEQAREFLRENQAHAV
jgi:hypothetical protein